MITNATYAGSSNTIVFIEPNNTNISADDPLVLEWVSAGNTINLYEEPLEFVLDRKTIEINEYANALIEDAYANPIQGTTTDSETHRNFMSVRRNNKANKLAGELT